MPTREELLAEAQRRGLVPQQPSRDDLIAEAQRRGLNVPEQSTWDKVKQAVKGQKEFDDAVSYEEWQWSQPRFGFGMPSIKTTMAGMFGSDADKLKSFQKNYNQDVKFDKYQNPYFEEGGKKVYIDMPGLDAGDVADFIGEAGTYAAGGVATAPIKGLGKRSLATGLVESGVNIGNQKLAGRDEINKTEAAIAGAGGAAFEMAAPLVSSIFRKVKGLKTSDINAGRVIADELGQDLTEDQLKRLGKYAKNVDFDQVDKHHLARMVEFDQTPTVGTALRDPNIMQHEDKLIRSGGHVQDRLQEIGMGNEVALQKSMDRLLSGRNADSIDAAASVHGAFKGAARDAKKATGEAYDSIGTAYAYSEPFKEAPQRIKRALSDNDFILRPGNLEKTNVALNDIQEGIKELSNAKGVSWQAVDGQRRRINKLFASADPEDKAALTVLKKEYDNVAFDAFEKNLLSGDADITSKLNNAREIATDYFNKFTSGGKHDKAGNIVDHWLNSDVTYENVADAIISANGHFKSANSAQMAKRYMDVVGGKNTPAGQDFKDMVFMRLTRLNDDPKTRQSLRTSLSKSLSSNNRTIMNEVFTKKELGYMSRALQMLDDTSIGSVKNRGSGVKAQSSGTTERLYDWLNSGDVDLSLNGVKNAIKKTLGLMTGARNSQFRLPTQQIQTPVLPAAGAMTADQSLNQ